MSKTRWGCVQQQRLKTCNVNRTQDDGRTKTQNISCHYILLFLSSFGPFSSISSSSPAIFKDSPQDSHSINFKSLSSSWFNLDSISLLLHWLFIAGFRILTSGGGAWRRLTLHFQPMVCLKLLWRLPGRVFVIAANWRCWKQRNLVSSFLRFINIRSEDSENTITC